MPSPAQGILPFPASVLHGRPVPARPAPGRSAASGRTAPAVRPTTLLCLDIETVPDTELVPADWPADKFPKPAWHRVVAVSYARARIVTDPATSLETYVVEHCRSGGEATWGEERLLRGFWRLFDAGAHRLVTWNGRSFDVPVLQLRAFVHGIPAGAWYRRGDRWSGYSARYSQEYHADLLELLSAHGASTRMGLDEMAAAMGLPGKAGEHGSNVGHHIAEGDIERVRNYCECDVLNTLGLYIRWSYLCGQSDEAGHDASMRSLVDYLRREGVQRPHLKAFLDRWAASARPAPMHVARGGRATEPAAR
ncbi:MULTISPECIES: 3'-5' exonuclease [Methylobacterium]|jgi:predicted PolB exonuclease-like 3'-5' exonuclease|uniref:3'-5' exonuclease n=1 Tax=Methylobacterium TaxID=407 RepID=UPI00272E5449|nr:3'-5' exonuclease [Methylobacterium sp.]